MVRGKTFKTLQVSVLRTSALKKYMQFCINHNQIPRQKIFDKILLIGSIDEGNMIIDELEKLPNGKA